MTKKQYEYVTGPDLKEMPANTIANANSLIVDPTIALNLNHYAELIATDMDLINYYNQDLKQAVDQHDYDQAETIIQHIKQVQKLVNTKHHHLYFNFKHMDDDKLRPLTNREVIELIQPTRFKDY